MCNKRGLFGTQLTQTEKRKNNDTPARVVSGTRIGDLSAIRYGDRPHSKEQPHSRRFRRNQSITTHVSQTQSIPTHISRTLAYTKWAYYKLIIQNCVQATNTFFWTVDLVHYIFFDTFFPSKLVSRVIPRYFAVLVMGPPTNVFFSTSAYFVNGNT